MILWNHVESPKSLYPKKPFQSRTMTQNVMDSGRWVESKHKTHEHWSVLNHPSKLQLQALLANSLAHGEEWSLLLHFHTLETAQTEAEFSYVILVSSSFFVQGPLKAKQFWGKCVLRDVLIPFTADCLRHTVNGTTEMFILSCKPGNISWLFQAVDAKVTLVCFVPTWYSLTFLWFHPHTLATHWKCQVFSFVEDMWVKIWSKCSCCLHPVLLLPKIKISSYS